ncbi:hypothetical protein Ddye_001523 [Dipteronia dyeriana]|uniref:DDE Tnp4 domain-containing protein n=1 Tax=Dipteronia dyeriana TaxID=168575 RepID=A0AAE0CTL7_9ROSI|nr:hypothetical protein Ddye_001523 [Dipteronia dyeriana]
MDLFQDCIGGIDETHIPEMITGHDVSSYRNRHETISQNVLAACNFDLEFMYVLSGWEGSAHDSKLLIDALTKRRTAIKVPQGKYFLVDCGFPNRRQFLAPFRVFDIISKILVVKDVTLQMKLSCSIYVMLL